MASAAVATNSAAAMNASARRCRGCRRSLAGEHEVHRHPAQPRPERWRTPAPRTRQLFQDNSATRSPGANPLACSAAATGPPASNSAKVSATSPSMMATLSGTRRAVRRRCPRWSDCARGPVSRRRRCRSGHELPIAWLTPKWRREPSHVAPRSPDPPGQWQVRCGSGHVSR